MTREQKPEQPLSPAAPPSESSTPETFDAIASDLQKLRARAGHVSYSEIVKRIGEQRLRESPGMPQPYPARTTVYDVFRPGRRRMNEQLLREIVRALGEDGEQIDAWGMRCARATAQVQQAPRPSTSHSYAVIGAREPQQRPPDQRSRGRSGLLPPVGDSEQGDADATLAGASSTSSRAQRHGDVWHWQAYLSTRPGMRVGIALLCLAINMIGHWIAFEVRLPIYADMIGTAVAALMLGPWWGAVIGLLSSLGSFALGVRYILAFAGVGVVAALVWGYDWRMIRKTPTTARYFLLNLAVATSCVLVGGPISLVVYGGPSDHSADQIAAEFFDFNLHPQLAFWLGNFTTEFGDKLIAGFLAITVVEALSYLIRPTAHAAPIRQAKL